jgi:hypothetical protein
MSTSCSRRPEVFRQAFAGHASRGGSIELPPSSFGRLLAKALLPWRSLRTLKIPAVFLENISDDRPIQRILPETRAGLGRTLFSNGLSGEKGDAPLTLTRSGTI